MQDLKGVSEKLSQLSPCMCLAKWTSVSLHLESGTTHSCHHPPVHRVPLDEIKSNPSALHNTQYKIEQRKKMLNGEKPSECAYCWNIEELPGAELSDRIIKSSESFSMSEFETIKKDPLSNKIKPTYLEVSFSNKCQFKCSYCSADYSSSWQEELLRFGDYKTFSGKKSQTQYEEETNPFVEAFWQWWPEIKSHLHTFRITGGEPLLAASTFRLLENLLKNPEPKLNLVINSNLGAPSVLMDRFVLLIEKLLAQKAVAGIEIYTSLEAFAEKAEYIRHGLNHDYFWKNIERVLSAHPTLRVLIMSTFNALSVTSYIDFLKKINLVNKSYRSAERPLPVVLDISYLRYPDYQSVKVLTPVFLPQMQAIYDFLNENQWQNTYDKVGFSDYQLVKMSRIISWAQKETSTSEQARLQTRFYEFFAEHDIRRNTSFLKTFPEMKEFWETCRYEFEKSRT
ncbi:MAG: twitch domain-containing radical SAM protein [Pseudobdellovibrio sp.]